MKPDESSFSRRLWRHTPRRAQRGSIMVNTAIALSLIVIVLLGTELGYLFFMKREFQKTVDLAALAGAQKLMLPLSSTSCQQAKDAAALNATENLPGVSLTTMECGRWDPSISNDAHFDPGSSDPNALRVTISTAPPIALLPFGSNRTITTSAIAALAEPVAAFSVGSRLLRLEAGGLLPSLLKGLGLDLGPLDLLSYKGLANVSIKPSGLLRQLGIPVSGALDVGTLNKLADIQSLTLGKLLDLSVAVLQQQGSTVSSQINLLTRLRAGLNVAALNTHIQLFGNDKTPGVLVGLDGTGPSALEANVDVLSLITAGLTVANGTNLITLGLDVSPLGITAKASIIEAPSIGIGGVGTIARTAQVRVYLRANTSQSFVGPILGFIGMQVDLPLIIELAQSSGKLTEINCKAPRKTATIAVSSSAANICIGRFHDMTSISDSENSRFFSTANRCAPNSSGQVPDSVDGVRKHQLLNVLNILPLNVRVGLPLLASQAPIVTNPPLNEPSTPRDGTETVTLNATGLDLATTADNIVAAVAGGILGDLLGDIKTSNPTSALAVAQQLVGTTGAGRSISEVSRELNFSAQAMEDLNARLTGQGLGGLLGGTLEGVGLLLTTVLINPLIDTVCLLGLSPTNIRNCRTDYVKSSVLSSGNNLVYAVLSGVLSLLKPLLDLLSTVIFNLLTTLGLSIGQTDASLISVDCGTSRLVY